MHTDELTTIGGLVARRASGQGPLTAFTFLDLDGTQTRTLTYRQLDAAARGVAALATQLRPGERVLIASITGAGFVTAFFGCQYAGMIAVPVALPTSGDTKRRIAALATLAHDCDAGAVLSDLPRPGWADELGPAGQKWVTVDVDSGSASGPQTCSDTVVVDRDIDDVAFLQYTSGSTAGPKGVMVTHRGLMHNHALYAQVTGITAHDTCVSWLPLFHDMGLIGQILQTVYTGSHAVIMPPEAFVRRPAVWLSAITRYRGTLVGAPNFAYDLCVSRLPVEQRDQLDLRSLRVAYSGAEPIRPDTLRAFANAYVPYGFDPKAVMAGYGLAEATLVVSASAQDGGLKTLTVNREALHRGTVISGGDLELVACGSNALHRTTAIVAPETRQRCADGTVGEIWVSGPDVALGYWNKPVETVETFGAQIEGEASMAYLRTGDLGVQYDGQLYVTGRLKDLLIVSGRNHYPQDIELTVESADERVRKGCVAAFSVEMPGAEEVVVVAEVVIGSMPPEAPGTLSDPSELSEKLRGAILREHGLAVGEVVLVLPRTIPKTSSGKLRRRACRESYLAGELGEIHRDRLLR